jgi:hypothetical protein
MRGALRRNLLAVASIGTLFFVRDASAQSAPACTAPTTSCNGTNGYYAAKDDVDRLTAVADPLLRELRTCLDAAGGKTVTPAFVIRWDTEGNPVSVKLDVPGYESLPCVAKASGKLSTLQNPRETAIRCEYGCPKPAAPPPVQPPLVVRPPGQTEPTQPPVLGQQPQTGQPAIPVLTPARPYNVRYEKVWYGWQGLISDAIAFTLTLSGGFSHTGGVLATGIIAFGLGTPIIHMAHGEVGRGFGSMGIRVLLPLLGAAIGAIAGLAASGNSRGNNLSNAGDAAGTGAIVGALLGGAGCAIIDAFALGYKSEKVEQPVGSRLTLPSSGRSASSLTVIPTFDVRGDRASLGIGGTF